MNENKTITCSNCSAVIPKEYIAGEWVKCPHCHSVFLVDYSDISTQNNSVPNNCGDSKPSSSGRRKYYFPFSCEFSDFMQKCFDYIMKVSPADIFAEMKLVKKQRAYIPALTNIGGQGSYYATPIDKNGDIKVVNDLFKTSFSGQSELFGIKKRTSVFDETIQDLVVWEIDENKICDLYDKNQYITNEIHYYPLYYLEYEYKGSTIAFASLGDNQVVTFSPLPIETRLKVCPDFVEDGYINNFDKFLHGKVNRLILIISLLIGFGILSSIGFNAILDFYNYTPGYLSPDSAFGELGIFILMVILTPYALKSFIRVTRFIIGYIYELGRYLIKRNINRKKMSEYYKIVKPIQNKKREDAKLYHNIDLSKLYILNKTPKIRIEKR